MKQNSRSAVENLRFMFEQMHGYLEGTMQDVDEATARYNPGVPACILGQYAHILASEDFFINVKLGHTTPVMMKMNPGFQTPPPAVGWREWALTEEIDLDALRSYAAQVYAATDNFLASVDDTILEEAVDLSEVGMGILNGAAALFLAYGNGTLHIGEISVIKGLQGKVGYPEAEQVPETAVA